MFARKMFARALLAVAPHLLPADGDEAALERRLARWLSALRDAWPQLSIDPALFLPWVASRLGKPGDLEALIDRNHGGNHGANHGADLYLAFAASRGDARAITEVGRILADLPQWLARLSPSDHELAEVRQTLHCKLLVAPAQTLARIAEYSGRGPLGAWLRVIALHTTLDLRRRRPDASARGDADLALELSPELAYLKQLYAPELQAAFDAAMHTLSARQRNLLRLHYLDALSTPKIAALLRLHRTTVRRQLDDAHQLLRATMHEHLRARFAADATEIDSLIRLAQSCLGISLQGYLMTQPG
jgi:RNA polymerase sigma-70 factor (ECF subfamily)